MRGRYRKKWFAYLVSAIMVITMLPATAFAEGEAVVVSTEEELTAALAEGGEIQLGDSITLTNMAVVEGGSDVTLDL